MNSPGQNTGVGSLSLLQGIFPTQGSNPGLPHCSWAARKVQRRVYFISDASNQRVGRTPVWRLTPLSYWQPTGNSFLLVKGGGNVQKRYSQLWQSYWNFSWGSVISFSLIVSSTASLQVLGLLCFHYFEAKSQIVKLMSWLQSGHRVVIFSTWWEFWCL